MFAKLSLIFLICLISLDQANSKHRHHDKKEENHRGPFNLNLNSEYYKVKNLTSQLYTEFFVLATGDNYLSPEISNDVHVNARAVVLLTQKLRDSKHAFEILANVTSDYALKGVNIEDKHVMTDVVNEVVSHLQNCADFVNIKNSLTDSFVSRQKYFKKEATPEEKEKVLENAWVRDPLMKLAFLNKLFYVMQVKEKDFHEFLKTIVDRSADEEYADKLDIIYSTALSKTVEQISPANEGKKAKERLVNLIVELLTNDAALTVKLYGHYKLMFINTKF